MESTPTTLQQLSPESQIVIRKMLGTINSMFAKFVFWDSNKLEKAVERMLQGDFSVPTFSHPRLKLAYLIIRRQILHLLTLENSLNENKKNREECEKIDELSKTKDDRKSIKSIGNIPSIYRGKENRECVIRRGHLKKAKRYNRLKKANIGINNLPTNHIVNKPPPKHLLSV